MKTYNNYSPELSKVFDDYLKENSSDNPLVFILNGIRTDKITQKVIVPHSFTVDPLDRIYDPWAVKVNKDKYDGSEIDIALVASVRPAPANSKMDAKVILGDIVFTREAFGKITFNKENRGMYELAKFLFFSNKNESNIGKPWHVEPRFGYNYHIFDKKTDNKQKVNNFSLIGKAGEAIAAFSEEDIDKIKRGLYPNNYQIISDDECRVKLYQIAQTDPQKIIALSKNADIEANSFITKVVESAIIEYDDTKKQWQWTDSKEKICILKPGQDKFGSLKSFFLSDSGIATAERLEEMIGKPEKA